MLLSHSIQISQPNYHLVRTQVDALKYQPVYKNYFRQVHQDSQKETVDILRKLIQRPLRSIVYFLHYHCLGRLDCSLWPCNCHFPAAWDRWWKVKDIDIYSHGVAINDLKKSLYLSVVPDMKSPLSDIFILAPLPCKIKVIYEHFSNVMELNDKLLHNTNDASCSRQKELQIANLTNLHYSPSTTTNNQTNMTICNTYSDRVVAPILLENNRGL